MYKAFAPKGSYVPAVCDEYQRGYNKFRFWRSVLPFFGLMALLLCAGQAQGQGQGCSRSAGVNVSAAGYTQLVPVPGSTVESLHICGIHLAVTQGSTPVNYRILACTDGTCTSIDPNAGTGNGTVQGHATYLDTVNLGNDGQVFQSARKGTGIFLYLSGAVTTPVYGLIIYGLY